MIVTLIAGILTGFIVSIPPLGPIAFALISKGFRGEIKEGMAIAAGSAFMDMVYALIAFGGISLFVSLLPSSFENAVNSNFSLIQIILIYAGCFVVIIYGIKIMKMKLDFDELQARESIHISKAQIKSKELAEKSHVPGASGNLFGLFLMGIMLCLSSITLPASWVIIVGYIKSFGIIDRTFIGGLIFSVGAFIGTFLWFWLLLKLVTGNKHRIEKSTIGKLNKIAGVILIILGIILFIQATVNVFNLI